MRTPPRPFNGKVGRRKRIVNHTGPAHNLSSRTDSREQDGGLDSGKTEEYDSKPDSRRTMSEACEFSSPLPLALSRLSNHEGINRRTTALVDFYIVSAPEIQSSRRSNARSSQEGIPLAHTDSFHLILGSLLLPHCAHQAFRNSAQQFLAGPTGIRGYRTVPSRFSAPRHTLRY